MTEIERIHKLMELLQASLDGKEIEEWACRDWYQSGIHRVGVSNVHHFRVAPNVVTKKYRVALFSNEEGVYTEVLNNETQERVWERTLDFVMWLTPWTEYTVEE